MMSKCAALGGWDHLESIWFFSNQIASYVDFHISSRAPTLQKKFFLKSNQTFWNVLPLVLSFASFHPKENFYGSQQDINFCNSKTIEYY